MIPVTGIRKAHFVALISMILCLVVATAAAQAQTNTSFHPTITPIGLNRVKVSFTMPYPTSASVSTSLDKSFGLTVLDRRMKKVHSITVPENAGKTYNIKVVAVAANGRSNTYIGSFPTGVIGSIPTRVTTVKTSAGGKIFQNGVPFFPIIALSGSCLDKNLIKTNLSMGVNIFQDATGCSDDSATWPTELDPLLKNQAWVDGTKPGNVQALQPIPEFMDWQASVRLLQNPSSLVGCSSYFDSSRPLYVAAKNEVTKGIVIYQVIVAHRGTPTEKPYCLDGVGMKNVFFVSIIAGVKGLRFFPIIPETGAMDVENDVIQAAGAASSCMDTIGTAILNGKALPVRLNPKGQLVANAWAYGGVTYIAAANTEKTATVTSVMVPSLSKATMATTVCGPAKSVKITGGNIPGTYTPLGVNIYKVLPPAIKKK